MPPRDELPAPARGGAGTGLPVISAPAAPSPCPRSGAALSACARRRPPPLGRAAEAPLWLLGSRTSQPWRPAPHLGRRNQTPPARPPQPPSRTSKPRTLLLYRPAPGYSPPSWTGLIAKLPGCAGGSHSRSPLVLSLLLDRHPRPESWLLGGENTAREGKREKKHSAWDTPWPRPEETTQRSPPSGKRGEELFPRACWGSGSSSSRQGERSGSNHGRKTTSGLGAVIPPPTRKLPAYRHKALPRATQGWGPIL